MMRQPTKLNVRKHCHAFSQIPITNSVLNKNKILRERVIDPRKQSSTVKETGEIEFRQ